MSAFHHGAEAPSSPGSSASGYGAGRGLGKGQDVLITPVLIETGKCNLERKTTKAPQEKHTQTTQLKHLSRWNLLRQLTLKTLHVIVPVAGPGKDKASAGCAIWLCHGRTLTAAGMSPTLSGNVRALHMQQLCQNYCSEPAAFVSSMSRLGI